MRCTTSLDFDDRIESLMEDLTYKLTILPTEDLADWIFDNVSHIRASCRDKQDVVKAIGSLRGEYR